MQKIKIIIIKSSCRTIEEDGGVQHMRRRCTVPGVQDLLQSVFFLSLRVRVCFLVQQTLWKWGYGDHWFWNQQVRSCLLSLTFGILATFLQQAAPQHPSSVKWGWQHPPFRFILCQLDDLTSFKCLEVVLVIQLGEGELVFLLRHSGKPPCSAFNIDAGSAVLPDFHYELLVSWAWGSESGGKSDRYSEKCAMAAEDSVWRNCFQREQTSDPRMVKGSWRKSCTCSCREEGPTKWTAFFSDWLFHAQVRIWASFENQMGRTREMGQLVKF